MKTGKAKSHNTHNWRTAADHTEYIEPKEEDFSKEENRDNPKTDDSSRMVKPDSWYFTHS